jgi:hypothetical protein
VLKRRNRVSERISLLVVVIQRRQLQRKALLYLAERHL